MWTSSVLVVSLLLCTSCQLTLECSSSCSVLVEMLLNFKALIISPLLPPIPEYSHLLLLCSDQHFLVAAPVLYITSLSVTWRELRAQSMCSIQFNSFQPSAFTHTVCTHTLFLSLQSSSSLPVHAHGGSLSSLRSLHKC